LIDVDKLPHVPDWYAQELIAGEGADKHVHILFKRSVINVTRYLISNTDFKKVMRYMPEQQWLSEAKILQVYGEMRSGNWWW
jgi:hypothetical protein